MVEIDISRDGGEWREPRLDRLIRRAVAAAIAVSGVTLAEKAEISVLLTDDAAMRKLNAAWRRKDESTNVLSFPAAVADALAAAPHLGDVILAYETVAAEAAAEGRRLGDHVAHLVVHGVLHLLGDDHVTDADALAMEAREADALASLGIADPYAVAAASDDARASRPSVAEGA